MTYSPELQEKIGNLIVEFGRHNVPVTRKNEEENGAEGMSALNDFEADIARAMVVDQFPLRRQLRGLIGAQKAGRPYDRNLARFQADLNRSLELLDARAQARPQVTYDDDLPIASKRNDIVAALEKYSVIVVSGETGSGKSTQLPKICLEMGRGLSGLIGHTQPRRIAARSVASRVADELRMPLGTAVGFKIRFTDVTGPDTYIKLMTDGILLAESQRDPYLNDYDTIIIDEAHERSLNIDFLIGYLKRLLEKRRDLKVIITSATIDAERFSEHFAAADGPAPIIEVSGRTYPVDICYRPLVGEDPDDPDWQKGVMGAVDEIMSLGMGDILIFMPTERDIHETAKMLRGRQLLHDTPGRKTDVLPLYARQAGNEQDRIFKPHGNRRIVIATNVAESSLTVPGIHYVIDPGTARISRYSTRSQVQRLPIEPISRASADQRAGRCGRVGPGICFRLYSEQDYDTRERFTPPEILRTNLASVILQTQSLKFGSIEDFPFLDPPKPEAIRDGYRTLFELGAIDEKQELTSIGKKLSQLPTDPRIGRMILAAHEENCLHEVLIIASALELQDPRERPLDKQQHADELHARFAHPDSDFMSYLKLWDFYQGLHSDLSRNRLRNACKQNFLSANRLREWAEVYAQLRELVQRAGMKQQARKDDFNAIHRALLAGLLSNIACKETDYEYTGAGGGKFVLWPGSGVFEKKPKWIVAAELVETSRRFLRTVAKIDPGWIEPLAGHLVNRSYSEPHWVRESSSTMAFEKVSLFGLTVVPRRRVAYGRIDPVVSRELLIRHGLVDGEFNTNAPFFAHNQKLLEEVEALQTRSRRPGMLLGEEARFEFYDERIPADAYDGPRFEKWRKDAEREQPRLLFMTEQDLVAEMPESLTPSNFPEEIAIRQMKLPLEYKFEPGTATDGITLTIPREGLNQLDQQQLGWLVPGLLEEKIVALIKSLPKPQRRAFVPAAETARSLVSRIQFGKGNLTNAVADALTQYSGLRISPDAFREDKLPEYLRMNVRVVDDSGKALAASRDLTDLRKQLGAEEPRFTAIDDSRWSRTGITSWDFGTLPNTVNIERNGIILQAYPALIDQEEAVAMKLCDSADVALRESQAGVLRLFTLAQRRELKAQVDWLPNLDKLMMWATTREGSGVFLRQLQDLVASRAFYADNKLPRTAETFAAQCKLGRSRIAIAAQDLAKLLGPLMQGYHDARKSLGGNIPAAWQYAVEDMRSQLKELTAPGFFATTPWCWLLQYARYFRAIQMRMKKLSGTGLAKDQKAFAQLEPRLRAYQERLVEHQAHHIHDPQLAHYRWMLEEFRVSLFAQELGTSITVSDRRLDKQWEKVRRE